MRHKFRRSRPVALFAVKAFHSFAFLTIQSAIVYLLYKGIRKETDRRVRIAAAIATAETLIYAGNGFRCPLTTLAEDLGAAKGSVTDIFLPSWLASNVARIYTPRSSPGPASRADLLGGRSQESWFRLTSCRPRCLAEPSLLPRFFLVLEVLVRVVAVLAARPDRDHEVLAERVGRQHQPLVDLADQLADRLPRSGSRRRRAWRRRPTACSGGRPGRLLLLELDDVALGLRRAALAFELVIRSWGPPRGLR